MDMQQKYIIEACTKVLYDGNPQGSLLESVKEFERKLMEYAEENPKSKEILKDSGLQDEYGQLYMAVMNRNNDYSSKSEEGQPKAFDYSKEQRAPTVHEFLDSYRLVYEKAIKPNNRPFTDEAYERLFDVENRTDDLIEAQIIIEKEGLLLNTVTADYKYIAEDFMEAADPNYEVTSKSVAATIGVYATAKSLDEITYMGELASATCDDIAVQTQIKVSMMIDFMALILAWEHAKKKVREGGVEMEGNAIAMVVTRKKMREYYRFLCEDMGITFEIMEKMPFYRISMLSPSGLDELWRIKKVMHPANIEATKYVLFEEILSDKTMEEILMASQPFPYYEQIDTVKNPEMDEEFQAIAEELNKDIKYFQRNRRMKGDENKKPTQSQLLGKVKKLRMNLADAASKGQNGEITGAVSGGISGIAGSGAGLAGKVSDITGSIASAAKSMDSSTKKSIAKSFATETAKDIGKGLLRGILRR